MFEPTLERDGIEILAHGVNASNCLDAVVIANLGFDRACGDKEAGTGTAESLEQCAVAKLSYNSETNACGIKPLVERLPELRAFDGQEKRSAVEAGREDTVVSGDQTRCAENSDTTTAQEMIESAAACERGNLLVGENDVETVFGKFCDEVLGCAFFANQLDRLGHDQNRLKDAVSNHLGNKIGDAYQKTTRPTARTTLDGVLQLATEAENLVSVLVNNLTDFSEGKTAARFAEELLAEGSFKLAELSADGGLSKVEDLARLSDAALPGDGPEVVQVMVVQPFHNLKFRLLPIEDAFNGVGLALGHYEFRAVGWSGEPAQPAHR